MLTLFQNPWMGLLRLRCVWGPFGCVYCPILGRSSHSIPGSLSHAEWCPELWQLCPPPRVSLRMKYSSVTLYPGPTSRCNSTSILCCKESSPMTNRPPSTPAQAHEKPMCALPRCPHIIIKPLYSEHRYSRHLVVADIYFGPIGQSNNNNNNNDNNKKV